MDDQVTPQIQFARESARKLLKQAGITSYPIRLAEVVKVIPNIHIDSAKLVDKISGMHAKAEDVDYIRYNENHSTIRNRFTVGHEIGHSILGHNEPCTRKDINTKDPHEVEANQFSAELLMPLSMLKEATKKIQNANELAYAFWVSKDAMSWRLLQTGLYKKLSSWS